MNEGVKHDDGKLPVGLIPPEALLAEAAILRHGAAKYGLHNWRKGIAYSRVIDAALRHITAWVGGEDLDAESGLPHLAHARCCLGFLIAYETSGPRNDDRYKPEPKDPDAPEVVWSRWTRTYEIPDLSKLTPKAEVPAQDVAPQFDLCFSCGAKTTGKYLGSHIGMCQHCIDRDERAKQSEQKIKLNKPTQLKCRSCGKVQPFGEGIIIDDDFKLCDDCIRPEHPCAGCGAATRRTFGIHGIPLCESCGDTKGEQAKDELYRKMRLWSVAQNEKAQASLEKSKQADKPAVDSRWSCVGCGTSTLDSFGAYCVPLCHQCSKVTDPQLVDALMLKVKAAEQVRAATERARFAQLVDKARQHAKAQPIEYVTVNTACIVCRDPADGTFGHGGPPICRRCYDNDSEVHLEQLAADWEKESDAQK